MAIHEISAYQKTAESWKTAKAAQTAGSTGASAAVQTGASSNAGKPEIKAWNPISEGSSLIPRKTDYGMTIGDVKLSDKAAEYYDQLKGKFGNMEFIVVSGDMKDSVKANAAMYGNASRQVVLIDEEKLERMATDENYRNKYEGIIAMSQARLTEMKNSLASTGAGVKNFGISVDENGNESFFATIEKSSQAQKERIEKHAEEKKEAKKAKEKAEKKEIAEKQREKAAEKRKAEKEALEDRLRESDDETDETDADAVTEKEYVTISSNSLSSLLNKVQNYSFGNASDRVMTEAEKMIGSHIDFKG
ncbi:MAG: DUF6033 family protein [Lachnospiraceae bacterium]|nr:DUF6033 family protein [Lachnospiraceae bacterium]